MACRTALLLSTLALTACQASLEDGGSRRLALPRIIGYLPRTQVTDHAALDLDQAAMEEELFLEKLIKARNVYEQGGHSRSFAVLKLKAPPGPGSLKAGEEVHGQTETGSETRGHLMQDISWKEGNTEDVEIRVQYTTSDVQDKYVGCQVGGLFTFKEANRDGCFQDSGSVVITKQGQKHSEAIAQGRRFNYAYNMRTDNNNGRTLQLMSVTAHNTMLMNGKYLSDFQKFIDYYGVSDYADRFFLSAEKHESLTFPSKKGSVDFTKLHTKQGLAEAMAKSTVTMHVFMYIVRELEDAVSQCHKKCDTCQQNALRALDQAVAFYAGSLQGEDGSGDGKMFYDLANQRALNFRTAGENGNDDEGTAFINIQIVREFKKMQIYLLENNCEPTRKSKNAIVNYMKVPLIQGVLRYAYIRNYQLSAIPENAEKVVAEGATYAAALLPFLHSCHAADAHIVYSNMRVGPTTDEVSFNDVKKALEKNYNCMGITCADVGGVWTVNGYSEHADPCGSIVPVATDAVSGVDTSLAQLHPGVKEGGPGAHGGLVFGAIMGVVLALALLALGMVKYTRASRDAARANEISRPDHAIERQNNIAAMSEIA